MTEHLPAQALLTILVVSLRLRTRTRADNGGRFAATPHAHEEGPPSGKPIRSAGITPAPALAEADRPQPAE